MSKKIFICEDDHGILEVMKMVLESEGYRVVTFSSCKTVVEEIGREEPDLLLLDLWMPEFDGESVIRRLRENEVSASLPVIIVSATSDIEKTAAKHGVNFLRKPFHIDELCETVKKHVGVEAAA